MDDSRPHYEAHEGPPSPGGPPRSHEGPSHSHEGFEYLRNSPRGFTASELEATTGFDRRTIAYYVQEELLPRVGRRGPRTRYPRFVRDRLLFIRRVRDAEEAGELPPVSLTELREAFDRLPRPVVEAVADGAIAVSPELFAGKAGLRAVASRVRSAAQRRMALEERLRRQRVRAGAGEKPWAAESHESSEAGDSGEPPAPTVQESGGRYSRRPPSSGDHAAAVLGVTLASVSNAVRRREESSSHPVDTWMRAEVAPGVELSVRGDDDEDLELLEQAAASLRSLVSGKLEVPETLARDSEVTAEASDD